MKKRKYNQNREDYFPIKSKHWSIEPTEDINLIINFEVFRENSNNML